MGGSDCQTFRFLDRDLGDPAIVDLQHSLVLLDFDFERWDSFCTGNLQTILDSHRAISIPSLQVDNNVSNIRLFLFTPSFYCTSS